MRVVNHDACPPGEYKTRQAGARRSDGGAFRSCPIVHPCHSQHDLRAKVPLLGVGRGSGLAPDIVSSTLRGTDCVSVLGPIR